MCALSGVSRSGYYSWCKNGGRSNDRETQDALDFQLIMEAYLYRGYDKGVMGIYMRLLHMGIRMNHKKIRRLMHKYGLKCPIRKANPYRRMAKAIKTNTVADNLLKREFKAHGPRKVFLTDITYIPYDRTFVYLSVIKDAFTGQALSYVLSASLEVDFVLETVKQLIQNHGASIDAQALIHSDQGCHYTSISFRTLLDDVGLRQSMSRRGNCWDNAPQESFFGHMKEELRSRFKDWQTFDEIKADIDDWMDYYNNDRYQLGLNKLAPNEYYQYITTGNYPKLMPRETFKKITTCP
jgi:transposase InsO family protein